MTKQYVRNEPQDWSGCTTIDTRTYRALMAVVRASRHRHNPKAKWCDAVTLTTECRVCKAIARLDKAAG
jgi:hypothetical protein